MKRSGEDRIKGIFFFFVINTRIYKIYQLLTWVCEFKKIHLDDQKVKNYYLVSLNLMKFVMESNVSDMCIPFI